MKTLCFTILVALAFIQSNEHSRQQNVVVVPRFGVKSHKHALHCANGIRLTIVVSTGTASDVPLYCLMYAALVMRLLSLAHGLHSPFVVLMPTDPHPSHTMCIDAVTGDLGVASFRNSLALALVATLLHCMEQYLGRYDFTSCLNCFPHVEHISIWIANANPFVRCG